VPLSSLLIMLGIGVDALRGEGEGWPAMGLGGGWGSSFAFGLLCVFVGLGVRLG
jgi:hypothetical protein